MNEKEQYEAAFGRYTMPKQFSCGCSQPCDCAKKNRRHGKSKGGRQPIYEGRRVFTEEEMIDEVQSS